MRKLYAGALCAIVLAVLAARGYGEGSDASRPSASKPGSATAATVKPSPAPSTPENELSLAAQVGKKLFFDKSISGGKNMSCASCHDPAYAYGPPNSLAVQLGSDPAQAGTRATPSLRYKDAIPAYEDDAENPDGATLSAPGGGYMQDGRGASLADQAQFPLLNPLEMNNASKAAVVQAVQNTAYADLFKQAFGADAFKDTDKAFGYAGQALQAFQTEDVSFHPYTSKFDLYTRNKIGGKFTAAETRGLMVFNTESIGNCVACHYAGANFGGHSGLMTDFTYQALGVPRNDKSIPNNPSPIPANQDPNYYDMGVCGPDRADHKPGTAGIPHPNPYCGLFKVPVLRNVATRGAFFHNGVFHTLDQVLHFYNTRDTHPEYWYPATGGSGAPVDNPGYALFPQAVPGATVHKFNDLPVAYQGNIDEEVPLGIGEGGDGKTLGSGTEPRKPGGASAMTEQNIQDLICFLNTLTDGYQPPATPPTSGPCVN
jgi:cytochrome c peroxidase